MAAFEGSVSSLLQGVSQQVPRERLPGQVSDQQNMLSDVVSGIRRRPGAGFRWVHYWRGVRQDTVRAHHTDLGGYRITCLVNTATGEALLVAEDGTVLSNYDTDGYLKADSPYSIRFAAADDELFILNTERRPDAIIPAEQEPPFFGGLFEVLLGEFDTEYKVTLTWPDETVYEGVYTTPPLSDPTAIEKTFPSAIAAGLVESLQAVVPPGVEFSLLGGIGFFKSATGPVTVHSHTDSLLLAASADAYYDDIIDLPTPLPVEANGWRVRVPVEDPGEGDEPFEYFAYNSRTYEWDPAEDWKPAPSYRACFYVGAGAFSSTYDVTISIPDHTFTASYVTPQGNQAGDAEKAAPAYIAGQLINQLLDEHGVEDYGLAIWQDGAYVYLEAITSPLVVTSGAGRARMVTSGSTHFPLVGELPARLPAAADGWVVAVGDAVLPQYYRYDYTLGAWLESAAWGSIDRIENMPVSVQSTGENEWQWIDGVFEGSLAGDSESNPPHRFMSRGISGMGTYQGRLVLLSGPMVSLSAAKHTRRFFRTTVTQLVDGDPVEVGSNSNSSADYTHAVPFMKDLVLFSESYQALIPYTNTAITPRTATVVLTSQHSVDTTCSPTLVGRTLMYPIPRSSGTYGMLEMLPSPSTDSQYVSVDVTQHLPTFFPGRCRFGASSGVSGIAVFGSTTDPYGLYVHEYIWDGDTKAQQAWHRWEMPYPISDVYFVQGSLRVLVTSQDLVMELGIDPRRPVVGRHWEHAHPETPEQPPIRDDLYLASKLYPVEGEDALRMQVGFGDGLLRNLVKQGGTYSERLALGVGFGTAELRPPIVEYEAPVAELQLHVEFQTGQLVSKVTSTAGEDTLQLQAEFLTAELRPALVRTVAPPEVLRLDVAFNTGELYEP